MTFSSQMQFQEALRPIIKCKEPLVNNLHLVIKRDSKNMYALPNGIFSQMISYKQLCLFSI